MSETSGPPSIRPLAGPAALTAWQEHNGDALAENNRNPVWNGVVKGRIAGSGITAAKSFALVVEQNPALKTDGYVFKNRKAYRLLK